MAKPKQSHNHLDYLGREVEAGQPVVFYHRGYKRMQAGRINRLSRVNATVKWIGQDGTTITRSVNPKDLLVIDDEAYVFHSLRNS